MPRKGSKRGTRRVKQTARLAFGRRARARRAATSTAWSGWPTTPIPGAAEAVARLRAAGARGRLRHQQLRRRRSRARGEAGRARASTPTGAVIGSAEVDRRAARAGPAGAGGRRRRAWSRRCEARGVEVVVQRRPRPRPGRRGRGRLPPRLRLRAAAGRGRPRCGPAPACSPATTTPPTRRPTGPIPGGGSILAAVERASGVAATVAGKPYPPMADLVRARLGPDRRWWSATGPTPTGAWPPPWAGASPSCSRGSRTDRGGRRSGSRPRGARPAHPRRPAACDDRASKLLTLASTRSIR